MNDLYKAIYSLKDIIAEEESTVNEKIDLETGYYTGTNITPTKLQLDRLKKRGLVPQDYQLPQRVSKTNPSARPFIDFINNLGKKASDKGEKIFPKQIEKQPDVSKPKVDYEKIMKGIRAQSDALTKGKVKATAANTKNYDSTLALQKELIARGAKIDADGIMGPQTRAAMKQFGQPGATPIARPNTTPKSGGPDKRFITGPEVSQAPKSTGPYLDRDTTVVSRTDKNFITGPELDMPDTIGKVNPKTPYKDLDKLRGPNNTNRFTGLPMAPNMYKKDAEDNYNIAQGPEQPNKKFGDDFINQIANSFGDIFKGSDKKGSADPLKLAQPKSDNTTKVANKNMIKRITGANT